MKPMKYMYSCSPGFLKRPNSWAVKTAGSAAAIGTSTAYCFGMAIRVVSIFMGVPQNGLFISWKINLQMDDLGVPPDFRKPPYPMGIWSGHPMIFLGNSPSFFKGDDHGLTIPQLIFSIHARSLRGPILMWRKWCPPNLLLWENVTSLHITSICFIWGCMKIGYCPKSSGSSSCSQLSWPELEVYSP